MSDDVANVEDGDTEVAVNVAIENAEDDAPPPEPEPPAEDGTDVVVIDVSSDGGESDTLPTLLDHERRLAGLDAYCGQLADRISQLETREIAAELEEAIVEDEMVEAAAETPDEDSEESGEDDSGDAGEESPEPRSARAHPMFRSWADWMNK